MKFRVILSVLAVLVSVWCWPAAAENKSYYGEGLCGYEGFKCIKVKAGDTWEKLFPDKRERDIVKRFNRSNMAVSYRSWIVVPTNLKDIDIMALSPFPDYITPPGTKLIIVNLALQAFGAYDQNGYLTLWGPVSGGKSWCGDVGAPCETMTGSFVMIRKQGPECESTVFPLNAGGGAPMPYCMHFYRGFALHGSTLPGYPASHGCVRMYFEDAKWLNHNFAEIGTRVIVTRDGSDVDLMTGKY